MSVTLDTQAQLAATGSGISNSDLLVITAWIKIPTDTTLGSSINTLLRVDGATHFARIHVTNSETSVCTLDYGGNSPLAGSVVLPTATWVLCIGLFGRNQTSGDAMYNYNSIDSSDSSDPDSWVSFTNDNTPQSMNAITIGSTILTQDCPDSPIAEAGIFSATSLSVAQDIVDELLSLTKCDAVTAGTLRWYRDLVSNGSTGAGTGDLSATGTVTYDDGADHPFAVGGGSTFIPRVVMF